jgi:hypothetical protein
MCPKGIPISEATKLKMSIAQRGRVFSDEHRRKLSLAGFNRPVSEDTRLRISRGNTGKHPSEETKQKMSLAHMGRQSPNKGKPLTPETKAKISGALVGRMRGPAFREKIIISNTGRFCSVETRAKLSEAKRGENAPNWKGGISFEPYCPKFNTDLRRRIRAFFDYRCMFCGKHENDCKTKLAVHHVTYNKEMCCDGKPVQFATLCKRHHGMTNTNRDRWESISCRIIEEIWQGRSYFTKEEWEKL